MKIPDVSHVCLIQVEEPHATEVLTSVTLWRHYSSVYQPGVRKLYLRGPRVEYIVLFYFLMLYCCKF
jgi:hypothetical protein